MSNPSRITKANLRTLCNVINQESGQEYDVGQFFGKRWIFINRTQSNNQLFGGQTKTEVYNKMWIFLIGVRETKNNQKS